MLKSSGKAGSTIIANLVKLLDHVMETTERIIENIIRDRININEMQFGFVPGCGTSNAIFILRQIREKHIAKSKVLYSFLLT